MLKITSLYDRVTGTFSYPVSLSDNYELAKRDLRDQIRSSDSPELSLHYSDKVLVLLGAFDPETGTFGSYNKCSNTVFFGDHSLQYDDELGHYVIFDLADLFPKQEDNNG